ncbi:MAG: tetratricopeptide repeat protein [Gammaproteobacteria bacterium]
MPTDQPRIVAESPPDFVGTDVCASCHERETRAWRGSHHDLAMQPATAETVLGDFADATFEHGGVESRFSIRDGRYTVRTDGPDGDLADFEIRWTFGVEPLQQYLVEFPDGRVQALALAWDTRPKDAGGQRWFHVYGDETITADDELHWTKPAQNWNYMCADCHSTGYAKNYDAAADTFDSTWKDIDVACEACHGPGSVHAARAGEERLDEGSGLPVSFAFEDRRRVFEEGATTVSIVGGDSPTDQVEACGRCHARRAPIAAAYEHGKPLMDTYLPALLTEPLYFPDGQIRDEVYVYGSFRQSRMYEAGVVCSDCHEPHSLELRAEGDAVCAQCHLPATYEAPSHTRHAEGADAPGCRDCHMPARNYMVVDPRRDHSFRVPRPDLAESLGVTDACAACHADEPAGWSAAAVREWLGRDAEGLQQFGPVFAAAQAGRIGAGADLRRIATDAAEPAIVRATAFALLPGYLSRDTLTAASEALADPDPAVRLAALGIVEAVPPEQRAGMAVPLLEDPVRAVRIEAARLLAGVDRSLLDNAANRALSAGIEEYEGAQQASLDRPTSRLNLGNLYSTIGDGQAAEAEYRAALRLDSAFEPAYGNLAEIFVRRGEEDAAGEVLRQGLQARPASAALLHSLGLHQIRSGERSAALASLERAVELAPDNTRFRYVYAVALDGAGRTEEALAELAEAHDRHPADTDVLWALVTMNLGAGNIDEGREYARALGRLRPDDERVRGLLNRLGSG